MWVIFFDSRAWVENRLGTCCRGVCLERNKRETGEREGRRDLCFFGVLDLCLERVQSLFTAAVTLFSVCNRVFIYIPKYKRLANMDAALPLVCVCACRCTIYLLCVNNYVYVFSRR